MDEPIDYTRREVVLCEWRATMRVSIFLFATDELGNSAELLIETTQHDFMMQASLRTLKYIRDVWATQCEVESRAW